MKTIKKNLLWVVYFGFIIYAINTGKDEHIFISNGPYPLGKYIVWLMYLSFLGYSLYCSTKENFFKSLKKLYPFYWARQIGMDLYIGITITSYLIYLNEGSILVLAIWILPILIYANLVTLVYVAINYDSIISHFI